MSNDSKCPHQDKYLFMLTCSKEVFDRSFRIPLISTNEQGHHGSHNYDNRFNLNNSYSVGKTYINTNNINVYSGSSVQQSRGAFVGPNLGFFK
jgi:hypothetical protein